MNTIDIFKNLEAIDKSHTKSINLKDKKNTLSKKGVKQLVDKTPEIEPVVDAKSINITCEKKKGRGKRSFSNLVENITTVYSDEKLDTKKDEQLAKIQYYVDKKTTSKELNNIVLEKKAQIPAVEQKVTEIPAQIPVVNLEDKVTELPAVEQKFTEIPAQIPVVNLEDKVTELPAVEDKVTELPAVEEKVTEIPEIEDKVTELPAVEEKVTELPAVEEKVTEIPEIEEKVTELPAVEQKVTEIPEIEEKVTELPAVEEKVTELPEVEEKAKEITEVNLEEKVAEEISKELCSNVLDQSLYNLLGITDTNNIEMSGDKLDNSVDVINNKSDSNDIVIDNISSIYYQYDNLVNIVDNSENIHNLGVFNVETTVSGDIYTITKNGFNDSELDNNIVDNTQYLTTDQSKDIDDNGEEFNDVIDEVFAIMENAEATEIVPQAVENVVIEHMPEVVDVENKVIEYLTTENHCSSIDVVELDNTSSNTLPNIFQQYDKLTDAKLTSNIDNNNIIELSELTPIVNDILHYKPNTIVNDTTSILNINIQGNIILDNYEQDNILTKNTMPNNKILCNKAFNNILDDILLIPKNETQITDENKLDKNVETISVLSLIENNNISVVSEPVNTVEVVSEPVNTVDVVSETNNRLPPAVHEIYVQPTVSYVNNNTIDLTNHGEEFMGLFAEVYCSENVEYGDIVELHVENEILWVKPTSNNSTQFYGISTGNYKKSEKTRILIKGVGKARVYPEVKVPILTRNIYNRTLLLTRDALGNIYTQNIPLTYIPGHYLVIGGTKYDQLCGINTQFYAYNNIKSCFVPLAVVHFNPNQLRYSIVNYDNPPGNIYKLATILDNNIDNNGCLTVLI